MNKHLFVAAAIVAMAGLSACNSTTAVPTVGAGTTSLTGVVTKGPFVIGSTVTAYQLVAGVRGQIAGTGSVTDLSGNYTVALTPGITGPFEIEVVGNYVDETTGLPTTTPQALTSVVNPPAVAAGGTQTITTSINAITALQAEMTKTALADPASTATADEAIQSSGALALETLGINTVDVYGTAVDPTKLNMMDNAADPTVNAQLMNASALFAKIVNDTAATTKVTPAQIAQAIAKDVKAGLPIGSSDPYVTTAVVNTATAALPTTAVMVTNLNNGLAQAQTAYATANPAKPAPAAPTTILAKPATTAPLVTALTGLAMAQNAFTIGTAQYTVDTYGAATPLVGGVTTTPYTNVKLVFTAKDYGAGIAPLAKDRYTSLNFSIISTKDPRKVQGSINPVVIKTDGLGSVAVTIPANATLNYSGTNSAGTVITPSSASNLAANIISTNTSVVSIDANALLNTIQAKVSPQNTQFNILNTAGTFNFAFGLGINIGHEAAAPVVGVDRLFPIATTGGRVVSGILTTN